MFSAGEEIAKGHLDAAVQGFKQPKKDKKIRHELHEVVTEGTHQSVDFVPFFSSKYFFSIRASLLRWPKVGSIKLHRFNIFRNARVAILGIDHAIFNSALPR